MDSCDKLVEQMELAREERRRRMTSGQVINLTSEWQVCFDLCVDGGMDGWVDGWRDGWMGGWMEGWMGGKMGG